NGNCKDVWAKAKKEIGFPIVIKPANQGSSIGVTILSSDSEFDFMSAVEKALFTKWVDAAEWNKLDSEGKSKYVHHLTDIREGIGMPIRIDGEKTIHDPNILIEVFNSELKIKEGIVAES